MMTTYLIYVLWGMAIGTLSGTIGLGGGILIVPTLIYLFGLKQHEAQGTSVALMIPPIGLMAAWRYYQHGHVIVPIAVCGAIGFFLGGFFGAEIAERLSEQTLRQVFGTVLIVVGIKMLWG